MQDCFLFVFCSVYLFCILSVIRDGIEKVEKMNWKERNQTKNKKMWKIFIKEL